MAMNEAVPPRKRQHESWPQLHDLPNVSKQAITMFYADSIKKTPRSSYSPMFALSVISQICHVLWKIQFPKLVLLGYIHTANLRVFSLVLLTPIKYNFWSTALHITLPSPYIYIYIYLYIYIYTRIWVTIYLGKWQTGKSFLFGSHLVTSDI